MITTDKVIVIGGLFMQSHTHEYEDHGDDDDDDDDDNNDDDDDDVNSDVILIIVGRMKFLSCNNIYFGFEY